MIDVRAGRGNPTASSTRTSRRVSRGRYLLGNYHEGEFGREYDAWIFGRFALRTVSVSLTDARIHCDISGIQFPI